MKRLTCTEDGASKFWEGSVEGSSLTVRFGKIGTAGQTKTKALASASAAEAELSKLVREKMGKGYVEDAGGAPAPTTKEASPAVTPPDVPAKRGSDSGQARFPFLFYGHRAADWFEGSKIYEIRFRADPGPDLDRAVEALAPHLAAGGGVEWAGPLARLCVEETEVGAFDALFERVEAALRALHAVLPIDQVVFLSARAKGKSPWDAWSLTERPTPIGGPKYDDAHSIFGEPRGAGARPASNPSFDGALSLAIKAFKDATQNKASGAALAKGEVTLVPIKATVPQPQKPLDPSKPAGRPVALPGRVVDAALSSDGKRALYAVGTHPYGAAFEVDLETGAARKVFEPVPFDSIGATKAVAYAADGAIVVGTNYHVYLADLANGELLAHTKCNTARIYSLYGGRAIFVDTFDGANKAFLFATVGGALKAIAKLKTDVGYAWQDGDRAFATGPDGTFEIVNVEAALEALGRKAKRK